MIDSLRNFGLHTITFASYGEILIAGEVAFRGLRKLETTHAVSRGEISFILHPFCLER
ncbi:hypothetical protein CK203_092998 [Vitis vinifera]|uniref:Uncharacterized protein n=1 Tax=Vitis vinifera TaxID=29760 RepID=A0A438DFK4_VITVI|nr:hypothetical protein CK203_092998 [Vitis vinifera]